MDGKIEITEKYERNNWPAVNRPDLKPPSGWDISLTVSVNRVRNHRLSPDGNTIAFIWDREDQSDIFTIPAAGGWPARLTTTRGAVAYWDDEIPQWSPDGEFIAFTTSDHVHVVPAKGGVPEKITDFAPGGFAPVWMPDSQRLLVSVERKEATQIVLTDREGAWPRVVFQGLGDAYDARPSPDGRFVALVFRPHDDLNRLDLKIVELETGKTRDLTGSPKQKDWWPRWSPDGERLAFLSQHSGFNEAWLIDPDGDNRRQLTRLGVDVSHLAWSPDGRQIACTVNRQGSFDLALIEAESGAVTTLKTGQGYYSRPNWSPDGAWLSVEYENPVQPPDLYRVTLPGGEIQQLTFSNLPALARNTLVVPELSAYPSFDGLEIPAFLYRPAAPNGAAIVYPHGGPSGQYTYEWDILAQYFIAKGYTYLAPNYRGSTGYGVKFEHANYFDWGGGDTQDNLFAARYLRTLAGINPARIGIIGGSYGGYMVANCLARDPDYLYACGVSKYADARLRTSWALCSRPLRHYTEMMLGHPSLHPEVYHDGSPIYQVPNIQKPVLILHGLLDDVVPPQASEEWVEALRRAGKTFEYKTYAGEPHGFLKRKNQLDVHRRIERFLDWNLMP